MILSTVVGSRLHGTASPDSDYDYRGVFTVPIIDILSPFREVKEAHWVEGKEADDTAYELTKFCKMASQGNPSVLEVLVGKEYPVFTEEGERLKELLPAFLSQRCFAAFKGYSRNQEKKFRDLEISDKRKWKYASAHVRTLYQLRHLLLKNELIGTYSEPIADELKSIKNGMWQPSKVFDRIFQLEEDCDRYVQNTKLPKEPDIEKIEAFLLSVYGH